MIRRPHVLLAAAAIFAAAASVVACEIRVRDSAFRTARDIHKLCVIADSSDSPGDEMVQRLQQWLGDTEDDAINLEIVRVDADDPDTNWRSIGIPSAPPLLPVTVLVGRDNGSGENFLIDHWEPAPTEDEFRAIIDSPLRRKLAAELARHVAVLIYSPRDTSAASPVADQLQTIVDAGIKDERIGLSWITVDRNDPSEQLLLRFMGLRGDSEDTVCVAFGRGKLMTPPLVGEEISADNVAQLVHTIRQACSCSKPLPTMGVDLPLIWSGDVDSTVVLMDQEIDLQDLDAEVQNMLALKANDSAAGPPVAVPIPSGQTSVADALVTGDSMDDSKRSPSSNSLAVIGVTVAGSLVLAMILLLSRRSTTKIT